jgi:hypothetical protein
MANGRNDRWNTHGLWRRNSESNYTIAATPSHGPEHVDKVGYGHDHSTEQEMCERRADDIAFGILQKAGINPYIAVSLFKKRHQPGRIKNFDNWKKSTAPDSAARQYPARPLV